MRHLDAFYAEDVETKEKFGTIEICELPKQPGRYGYFFRSLNGEYTELYRLESKSVQECRKFEETKLKELVNEFIATMKMKNWRIYRTRPTIWDDASKLTPEITNQLFLESKQYLFVDDEQEE